MFTGRWTRQSADAAGHKNVAEQDMACGPACSLGWRGRGVVIAIQHAFPEAQPLGNPALVLLFALPCYPLQRILRSAAIDDLAGNSLLFHTISAFHGDAPIAASGCVRQGALPTAIRVRRWGEKPVVTAREQIPEFPPVPSRRTGRRRQVCPAGSALHRLTSAKRCRHERHA